jgi:hypothetical protein
MLGVTIFGLLFTPVFYVVSRWIASRLPGRRPKATVRLETLAIEGPSPE